MCIRDRTVRVKLPEGFQKSEFLLKHGMIDMIVSRSELKEKIYNLVSKLSPKIDEA